MTDRQSLDVDGAPSIRVELVEGDLVLTGTDQATIEAVATRDGQVWLRQEGEVVVLTADRGARLKLPKASRVEIVEIKGDLRVRNLETDLDIDRVKGDADLTHVAGANINKVGGNMKGKDIRGDLAVHGAGGDVRLKDVEGGLKVALGGDLTLKRVGAPLDATAGGDAVLQIEIEAADPVRVVAGGNIVCRLMGAPSATITMTNGGERTLDLQGASRDDTIPGRMVIGAGEADVSLRAGGDIWVGGTDASGGSQDPSTIGSRVAESVGKTLAEVEAGLATMGAVMESVPEGEISTKVQRIVERTIRRRQRGHIKDVASWLPTAGTAAETEPAGDEERMKILKVVESGKLSVEDAEKLFEAMGV